MKRLTTLLAAISLLAATPAALAVPVSLAADPPKNAAGETEKANSGQTEKDASNKSADDTKKDTKGDAKEEVEAPPCKNESVFILKGGKPADLCNLSFAGYLRLFLEQLMPLVLFLAVVIVAFSGVQYMLGGISKDGTGKAKQRIVGTISGVILFVAISLILRILANNIVALDARTGANPQTNTSRES